MTEKMHRSGLDPDMDLNGGLNNELPEGHVSDIGMAGKCSVFVGTNDGVLTLIFLSDRMCRPAL